MKSEKTPYDLAVEALESRRNGIAPIVSIDYDGKNWIESCGKSAEGAGYISMEGLGNYVLHKRDSETGKFFPDYGNPLNEIEIGQYFFPSEHLGIAGGEQYRRLSEKEINSYLKILDPEASCKVEGGTIILNKRLPENEMSFFRQKVSEYSGYDYTIRMPSTLFGKVAKVLLAAGIVAGAAGGIYTALSDDDKDGISNIDEAVRRFSYEHGMAYDGVGEKFLVTEKAVVTEKDYDPPRMQHVDVGDIHTFIMHPARYDITFECPNASFRENNLTLFERFEKGDDASLSYYDFYVKSYGYFPPEFDEKTLIRTEKEDRHEFVDAARL